MALILRGLRRSLGVLDVAGAGTGGGEVVKAIGDAFELRWISVVQLEKLRLPYMKGVGVGHRGGEGAVKAGFVGVAAVALARGAEVQWA